jgi:hypothetical protein
MYEDRTQEHGPWLGFKQSPFRSGKPNIGGEGRPRKEGGRCGKIVPSSVNLLGLTRRVRASTLEQMSIPVVEASLARLLQTPPF